MDKKKFVRALFIIWLFIWVLFLIRPYFKNHLLRDYSILLASSLEGKKAFMAGEELHAFIKFCNQSITPQSSYKIIGLENDPLSYRRAVYYLYPNIENPNPVFLLVYKTDAHKEHYRIFKTLDSGKYILMREDK